MGEKLTPPGSRLSCLLMHMAREREGCNMHQLTREMAGDKLAREGGKSE